MALGFAMNDGLLSAFARGAALYTGTMDESERAPLMPYDVEIIPDERVEILDSKTDEPHVADGRRAPIDVMAVITKALTQAGLMKPPA